MRILLLSRKWLTLALSSLAVIAIFCAVSYPASVSTAGTARQLPIYSVDTGDKKVCSISFDAAWGADNTGKILEVLEQYQVRRCFYGHLHGGSHKLAMEGLWNGVDYRLVAADYIGFQPIRVI